jgi:hypothetical protein
VKEIRKKKKVPAKVIKKKKNGDYLVLVGLGAGRAGGQRRF